MTGTDLPQKAGHLERSRARRGSGLGLRREHHDAVLRLRPRVDSIELISESFMVQGGSSQDVMDRVRADYPVALHGVSASLGSAQPLDVEYLGRLACLVKHVDPFIVSDHLGWSRLGGHDARDPLPLAFTEESVRVTAANIRRVQDRLGRRILVENVSGDVRFSGSSLTEWEFVGAVAEEADSGILLDLNNLYANARKHGFEPTDYLAALPPDRIEQFHLSGRQDHGDRVLDTHKHPIVGTVWDLFRAAVRRFGPRPAIIECGEKSPPLETLLAEVRAAGEVLDAAEPARRCPGTRGRYPGSRSGRRIPDNRLRCPA